MPECEKMRAVKDKGQAIGEFLEWLQGKGVHLATHHEHDDSCLTKEGVRVCGICEGALVPWSYSTERLLAEFFNINLDEVEAEKRALLDAL